MNSFHDQILSEIDAARNLAADFASRNGRGPTKAPRASSAERLAQEQAAAAEIAALAAEEERVADEARERAKRREKARAEEHAIAKEAREATLPVGQPKSRWSAMAVLKGLAKLRAEERSAAEELIRKAQKVRVRSSTLVAEHQPYERERVLDQPATPIRGMWRPSLGAAQVWYFTSGETRCGPVTFKELQTMAASRVLDPRLDMVWKEGMEGWEQAGHLDGLFERRTTPAETPVPRGGRKSRRVTALPTDLTAALATRHLSWPGVSRRTLWLGLLLFPMLWSQLLWWSTPTLIDTFGSALISKLLPFSDIVVVAVLIQLVFMRLVNLGMSRWWALVLVIPLVNLWVAFRCLICPSGYAYHRKLDQVGMIIAVAIVVVVPILWYINLQYPNLLSFAQLQEVVHRQIEKAGN